MNWVLMLALLGGAKEDEVKLTVAESNLLQYVNASRVQAGLPPLKVDKELQDSTRAHCEWMANRRIMQHAGPFRENIAHSQQHSSAAHRTWMNSPPHRSNIMCRSATKIGVAGYVSPTGRIYWCMRVN